MFGHRRRSRKLKKVKPGDGSALRPYRAWHALWRSLFVLDLAGQADVVEEYAVDVDFFDWDGTVALYRNGTQAATATLPAAFPVPGGVIEVATSTFGLKRIHMVGDDGTTRRLRPHPRSAEAWRARLGHRHPGPSRAIAGTAIAVLLVSLALGVPQVIELVSHIPPVAERFGTFESPISLPAWLNTTLVFASVAAAIERALTLRNHWLVDADTWWLGD